MNESQQEIGSMVNLWRSLIVGDQKSWVMFENGTCLILMQPEANLAAQARQIMSTWGPVSMGTSAEDFEVVALPRPLGGWIVTCHHPDMLNYVSTRDYTDPIPSEIGIGLIGRRTRDCDAHTLNVVHIEDKRARIIHTL